MLPETDPVAQSPDAMVLSTHSTHSGARVVVDTGPDQCPDPPSRVLVPVCSAYAVRVVDVLNVLHVGERAAYMPEHGARPARGAPTSTWGTHQHVASSWWAWSASEKGNARVHVEPIPWCNNLAHVGGA
jgi:hypothetical protein